MLKIGLTGGIGAGKTTVSDEFLKIGIPVVDTDVIARDLVAPGSPALQDIVDVFGGQILSVGGQLDRKGLGHLVFSDKAKKEKLEAILHPRIRKETLDRVRKLSVPYCIIVVPLLIETDFIKLVDKVLVVDAPEDQRLRWIICRNGLSETEIRTIFNAQIDREHRLRMADYTILNDSTLDDLKTKVAKLHFHIMSEIQSSFA